LRAALDPGNAEGESPKWAGVPDRARPRIPCLKSAWSKATDFLLRIGTVRSCSQKKASPMSNVGFPLLLIPVAIYNIIVFLMPGVSLSEPVVRLTLLSGAEWPLTLSDMLLALAILLLLLEVIKGARPGAKYLTDHLLSLIVFGGAAAEFLLWPRFGTSTYFLLTLLALVDFLSGIALRARRKMVPAAVVSTRNIPTRAAPPEPQFEPPPAPAPAPVPAAAPAGEPVLDRPEPRIVRTDIPPVEPTPEVRSPGSQSDETSPPSSGTPPR
jgi:hypothetical protein